MLSINCRFSTTVLNEFVDGCLEAGDRAPYAPNMLQVGSAEADVTMLFGLYRPWFIALVFAESW